MVPLKNSIPPFGLYWPILTGPKVEMVSKVAGMPFKGSPHETEKSYAKNGVRE